MYLKRLEMRGFKSFADKTYIDFDNGVTCIVGPNGSGKSNITDAIRWVLGEQKIKTLRGTKMEDIIFNGTNHRKKLGMAEVTLFFDNSERYFSLDYNEVKVCRRVYRSGESEYLINDTNCRLKDVRDLFMDTGIGTDGYSIIGQGRIERVLSNNPDERRQLFEEAAGIVKFKTRKRETERKLDNTEQNLIRIEDIFSELSGRVEPLRIESEKAKKHIELTDRLSELELNLFINEIESVDKKIQKETENLNETSIALQENSASQKHLFEEKNQLNLKIESSNQALINVQNSFYEDKNVIAGIDGEMNVVKTKMDAKLSEEERLKAVLDVNNVRLKEVKTQKDAAIQQKDELTETLSGIQSEISSKQQNFEAVSNSLFDAENMSETHRQSIIAKLNEAEKNRSEISSYHTILDNHMARRETLDKEIEETDALAEEAKTKEKEHDHQLIGLKESEANLIKESEKLKSALKTFEVKLQNDNVLLNDQRKKLTEYSTECTLLKQMEKDHAGYDQSVKKALQMVDRQADLKEGLNGVVASLMSIPKKYEVALEIALGKSIQNLVVETPGDAKKMIAELKRTNGGRVTFIPLSTIKSKGDQKNILMALEQLEGYIGKANELFDYDSKYDVLYDYLVGRTVIVDTVETATEALKIKDLKYKVVTLEGDVFIPGGTITGGSYKSRSAGILSRKRKIDELEEMVVQTDEEIKKLSEQIQKIRDDQKEYRYDYEQNSKISEEIRLQIAKKENDIQVVKDELSRLMSLSSKRKSERIIIENDIQSVHDAITKKEDIIKKLEKENKELELKITEDVTKLDGLKLKMQSLRESLTEVKVKNASLLETLKNVEMDLNRLNESHDLLLDQSDQSQQLLNDGIIILNELKDSLVELSKKKDAINKASSNKHVEMEKIHKDIKAYEKSIFEINTNNKALFDYIENLKETLHKFEIKKTKYDVHREDIAARLFERYEMTPEDAIKCKKDIDVSGANKDIKEIKRELKIIGDVSIHAIEEYEEVYERYHFLKEQHDDLVAARNTLKKLVRELEKEMKEKFLLCFDVVKVNFAEIFESLFVGGSAELTILDIDNVLESDIGINVQPPGKKLQSISLLSGGEKALTAIALLFAILKTKPAPFCILDEIEAALDDVNVYRFADFLKEFTRNSQFVIITHRKGTMEIADNLFGVTMQEFGISKMLSVKLEDAILE
ncbi:MAG: chromosome segregation protein SMC [Clostridiales bacterium]|nr:chromosome segregation protein SMC [Clostridiales bacterium]